MAPVMKHLGVEKWLQMMGMMQYYHIFSRYEGVEDVVDMTEREMNELGVHNSAHRITILSSLTTLRDMIDTSRKHASFGTLTSSATTRRANRLSLSISPSEKMRSDLDNELRGDTGELRSHGWYHGNIPRVRAEKLCNNPGEFLVRDCTSRPGDFVLTTCSERDQPLHFMINCRVLDAEPGCLPKILYQFEELTFSSVQLLVQYYLSAQAPVTAASGTVISWPITRRMPLSYYDTKFGVTKSPSRSPSGSPQLTRPTVQRSGSHPALMMGDALREGSKSPSPLSDRFGSLPTIHRQAVARAESARPPPKVSYHRSGSEPLLTPTNNDLSFNYLTPPRGHLAPATSDTKLNSHPPPKPSRVPSVKYRQRPVVVVRRQEVEAEDERDYSDYATIKSEPSWVDQRLPKAGASTEKPKRVLGRRAMNQQKDNGTSPAKIATVSKGKNFPERNVPEAKLATEDFDIDCARVAENSDAANDAAVDSGANYTFSFDFMRRRRISLPSIASVDAGAFSSTLLPADNKPLEPSVVLAVKTCLLANGGRSLAYHMTRVDLDMLKIVGDHDLGMGVQSGLELLTLPQGAKLRDQVIERCECVRLFVATTILTSTNTTERTRMLHTWIQVAMELKTSLGNLFGFVSVMNGISSPQISRLRDTWLVLRQIHTGSAYFFDTKLRAFYRSQNDGSAALPLQDVTIPNVSPLIQLMQRNLDTVMQTQTWESSCDLTTSLDMLLLHLDTARLICSQSGLYRITSEQTMSSFTPVDELADLFHTEFLMRYLWGTRGSGVARTERCDKYEQLLTALSNRAERPGDEGTEL